MASRRPPASGTAAHGAALGRVIELCAPTLRDQLAAPRPAGAALHLAVIGEFSAGKTYLVNRLVDEPGLLATSARPTTGVPTYLARAARLRITADVEGVVHTAGALRAAAADGSLPLGARPAALRSSRGLIGTLTAGDDLGGRLRAVHIGHPAARLPDDAVLIDTPGINSTETAHVTRAQAVVDTVADAVIVVLAAASGIRLSLLEYLQLRLDRALVENATFVVTKTHEVEPDERAAVFAYLGRALTRDLELTGVELLVADSSADLDRIVARAYDAARTYRAETAAAQAGSLARAEQLARRTAQSRLAEIERFLALEAPRPAAVTAQLHQIRAASREAGEASKRAAATVATNVSRRAGSTARAGAERLIAAADNRKQARLLPAELSRTLEEQFVAGRDDALRVLADDLVRFAATLRTQADAFRGQYAEYLGPADAPVLLEPPALTLDGRRNQSISEFDAPGESSAGSLAAAGALVGTFFVPGLGSLIGGAVGGAAGGLAKLFAGPSLNAMRTTLRAAVQAAAEAGEADLCRRVLQSYAAAQTALLAAQKAALDTCATQVRAGLAEAQDEQRRRRADLRREARAIRAALDALDRAGPARRGEPPGGAAASTGEPDPVLAGVR